MNGEILSVSRLTVGYGEHPEAADVSFSLQKGEILCLVGESGCGKSTVLKALLAAPEIRLFDGTITLEGQVISELPDKERRALCSEKMGIVFQSPEATFNPIRSYRKQFIETLKSHGRYERAAFDGQVDSHQRGKGERQGKASTVMQAWGREREDIAGDAQTRIILLIFPVEQKPSAIGERADLVSPYGDT